MARMPPFEMVKVPWEKKEHSEITRIVGTRHYWLTPIKGYSNPQPRRNVQFSFSSISYNIPSRIELNDTLTDRSLILDLSNNNKFFIKYGSDNIFEERIENTYPLPNNVRKLYDNKTGNYELIKKKTVERLIDLDKEMQGTVNKWGINFSYVYYCGLGFGISIDPYDKKCPFQKKCKVCDGEKFWSRNRRPFPKVFVDRDVEINPEDLQKLLKRRPFVDCVEATTFRELKHEIIIKYDRVSLIAPAFLTPKSVEFYIKPLGYEARTSLVSLIFNKTLLKFVVSQAIKERNIRKSLELKYYVLHRFAGYVNIKNSIKSLIREEQEPITDSVLIDFGYKTLLHTLAHLFILYLVTQKGVEQDDVLYFVDGENACIHVLEASKNDGLGLVETIKNQLEKGEENNLLEDFYNNAKEFLVTHDEKVGRFEQELTKEAKEKLENVQNIKELIDLVEETNDELGEWLEYIDTPSYRECLVSNLRKELYEMSEYWLASVFYPDTHVHLCADGCNECLVFQQVVMRALCSDFHFQGN